MNGMSLADFLLSIKGLDELSAKAQVLLVAYYLRNNGKTEFSRPEFEAACTDGRLPVPANLDVKLSQMTTGQKALLIAVDEGRYALSVFGVPEVEDLLGERGLRVARPSLERLVGKIATDAEKEFLAEAIACLAVSAKRAAAVMVWELSVNHMQDYVIAHKLAEFNGALAARRDYRGLTITTKDDFAEIKREVHFIEVLRGAGIISPDIRKILDEHLGFRNTCGHPNTVKIPETKVVAMIEDLVENVVLRYPLA